MYIDNPEALKTWLTGILEPLCDADPAALAKYVLALAKKDKPEPELKATMLDQLEVFLQKETARFVDLLFAALQNKSYLDSAAASSPSPAPAAVATTVVQPPEVAPPTVASPEEGNSIDTGRKDSFSGKEDRKEISKDKDEKRSQKTSSSSNRTRSRSRSRSRDRGGRNRSRSPPSRRDRDRTRHWDRRHSPSSGSNRRDGGFRRKSRSPPPGRRSRSPTTRSRNRRNRSDSRSWSPPTHRRSVSPRKNNATTEPAVTESKKSSSGQTSSSGPATPTQDSNHGVGDEFRLTTTAQSIQSVVVTASGGTDKPKWRCRDFDEKGFCMRGDLCPYDHGTDPVVLEDVELTSVLSYNSRPAARANDSGRIAPPDVTAPPPSIAQSLPPAAPGEQYNPAAPSIGWNNYTGDATRPPPLMLMRPVGPRPPMGANFNVPPPPFFNPAIRGGSGGPMHNNKPPVGPPFRPLAPPQVAPSRELISVPMQDSRPPPMMNAKGDRKRPAVEPPMVEEEGGYNVEGPPSYQDRPKRRHFDYSRLGHRRHDGSCCSLEVKKIPKGLNNISQLNNHFSKFGKIVNLQVCFNGDPEAALVTFTTHAEAQAAYRSAEAVLNNRFIKVFWYNPVPDNKQENLPPQNKLPAKERLGKVPMEEEAPAVVDEEKEKEKELEREKAVAAIVKSQEMLAAKESLRKKQEDKKREAAKLQSDLQRRKQDLLEKQLQQQRILIERLEKAKATLKPEERNALITTLKHLQESVEGLKRDLSHTATAVLSSQKETKHGPATGPAHVTKIAVQEAKKAMLDVDLELYQKPEMSEEEVLQNKIRELKRSALEMGLTHAGRGLRGRGRGRVSRARGARSFYVPPHVSVDRRPTALMVSGFEPEDQSDVLSHFAQFGDIVDHVVDDSVPSLVVNYKSRKEAEIAAVKGKGFRDRVLTVNWHLPNKPRDEEREEDAPSEHAYDDALNYDEDEEDVEEERSWRR